MTSPSPASSPPATAQATNPSPSTSPPRQQQQQQQRHDSIPDDEPQEEPTGTTASADTDATLPPLFTLVHNSTSKTTHHPHVHYIFADDDPDVLAGALAASEPSASAGADRPRAVLLDLAPGDDGGWEVSRAASLSADWAVVDAGVRRMEGAEGRGEGVTGGLMLRIEGVDGEAEDGGESSGDGGSGARDGREEYRTLVGDFEMRMAVLRKVVGAGEDSRRVSSAEGRGEAEEEEAEKEETEEGEEQEEEEEEEEEEETEVEAHNAGKVGG